MRQQIYKLLCPLLFSALTIPNAHADTQSFNDILRGSANGYGQVDSTTQTYITGEFYTHYVAFFQFDLTSLSGQLSAASFTLTNPFIQSTATSDTITLYASPVAIPQAYVTYPNDLTSGSILGNVNIAPTSGTLTDLTINLNSSALAILQANEGHDFTIAMNLSSNNFADRIGTDASAPYYPGSLPPTPNNVLTIDTVTAHVPEPSLLALFSTGIIGLGVLRKK